MHIRPAIFPDEAEGVRALLREYAAGLGVHLCFQRFEEELAGLPGLYAPPAGRFLLACDDDETAGCVALRPLADGCEMKRLYVRPAYRGRGLGRLLAETILAEAAAAGYPRIYLDTLPSMNEAAGLYRALGFADAEPYYYNPVPGALFLCKELWPAG